MHQTILFTHSLPAPLAKHLGLPRRNLTHCFITRQIFIHPKRSIHNGDFRANIRNLIIFAFVFLLQDLAYASEEKEICRFTTKDGVVAGVAYAKFFDNEFFKQFYIKKNGNVLFSIDNENIIGLDGIEGSVSKENLFAYKVVLFRPTYIVLVMVASDGHGISDDITIEWDETSGQFHLLKVP